MGLLDVLKSKIPKNAKHAAMLNGYTPIFSQFGQDIYASDVVQQAISCIINECTKLLPTHIRGKQNDDVEPVAGNIQNMLNNPNELMTTSEFIEKIVWNLFLNYNSWIIPVYDIYADKDGKKKKAYRALYPVQPTQVDFFQTPDQTLYVKLAFANGYCTELPYTDVIHIRHHFSVNDYMGGNSQGQPDNEALLKTLNLNHQLLESVTKALQASFAVNGVVKYNTMLDDGATEKELLKLEEKIRNSASGFLPLDLKAEFMPIDRKINLVDPQTLKFIDEKILRHYGVSLCILSGDYTKQQYEAFYQKTIEPLVRHISESFTKTLFTQRELEFGNKIVFYTKDLVFMSTDQTLEMINLLGQTGTLYENEKRTAFGLRPLPELKGVRMMSLNWVNAEYAREYQLKTFESKKGIKQNETE